MKTNVPFLTAQWKELTLLNFRVEPSFMASTLPSGLIPDLYDGWAYASLVSFDFEQIRVGGIAWPGYTSFPEFNLRTYVRCEEANRRGVMFVRELVPMRLPALLARVLYNEPYSACPMQREVTQEEDGSQRQVTTLAWKDRKHQVTVQVGPATRALQAGSAEEWFTDQQWGFGLGHDGGLNRYHVSHPRWLFREVHEATHEIDWLALYGPTWAKILQHQEPSSVLHAIGSEVAVYPAVDVARPNFS